MVQLAYTDAPAQGFPGMLADNGPRNDVATKHSEEVAGFPAGVAIVAGTDPDKEALLPTGADTIVGVSLHSHANEVGGDDDNLIDPAKAFNSLRIGRVLVEVEEAVTPDSPVFIRIAAGGGGSQLGAFRASADTASALAASGMRFLGSAGIAGLVVLEIDPDCSIA